MNYNYDVVECFIGNILQDIKDSFNSSNIRKLKDRNKITFLSFVIDIDSIFACEPQDEQLLALFDNFLVDLTNRNCNIVLVSQNPVQHINCKIYKRIRERGNQSNPIIHKNYIADIGFVLFTNNNSYDTTKILRIVNCTESECFLNAWSNLSDKQKDRAILPIENFDDDVENSWYKIDALAETEHTGNLENIETNTPHFYSSPLPPMRPFYKNAEKIRSSTIQEDETLNADKNPYPNSSKNTSDNEAFGSSKHQGNRANISTVTNTTEKNVTADTSTTSNNYITTTYNFIQEISGYFIKAKPNVTKKRTRNSLPQTSPIIEKGVIKKIATTKHKNTRRRQTGSKPPTSSQSLRVSLLKAVSKRNIPYLRKKIVPPTNKKSILPSSKPSFSGLVKQILNKKSASKKSNSLWATRITKKQKTNKNQTLIK